MGKDEGVTQEGSEGYKGSDEITLLRRLQILREIRSRTYNAGRT